MTDDKKDGCCSTKGCCCGSKKFVFGLLIGVLVFMAGMMFAKSCPMGGGAKMCPISAK